MLPLYVGLLAEMVFQDVNNKAAAKPLLPRPLFCAARAMRFLQPKYRDAANSPQIVWRLKRDQFP
jgi:hypothetical protein